jgi:hypothetical protein
MERGNGAESRTTHLIVAQPGDVITHTGEFRRWIEAGVGGEGFGIIV